MEWYHWLIIAQSIAWAVASHYSSKAAFFSGCARGCEEGFTLGHDAGYLRALSDDDTTRRERAAEIIRKLG